MTPFIHDDFMLSTGTARRLFHDCAEKLPVIDYHCHLDPRQIAENVQFKDITRLWIVDGRSGDHYKWRAMRAAGVPEEYITGGRTAWEKFAKWAETMPCLMRNPLYHWSHLELSRVFGIDSILKPETAREIFDECNAMLATPEFRGQALIRRFNVEVVCTTDDPADDLRWHRQIAERPFGTKVLPTWRPDKVMGIEDVESFNEYLARLGASAGIGIRSYSSLIAALRERHDFFESMGCRLSDHGLDTFYAEDYDREDVGRTFAEALSGSAPDASDVARYKSAVLYDLAVMDAESGWTQQFHIGPLRNNRSRIFRSVGPDAGCDSIDDKPVAESGNRFLDRLDESGNLAKTILYCLNPKDNEVMTTMAYNFNDGSVPGKMQFGSGWWFLDQENGMRRQIDALSSLGLLSRFVGMLTDSRSFISYPRHEYFRRILCDVLGTDVENGKIPSSEMDTVAGMVRAVSYGNAKEYFGF